MPWVAAGAVGLAAAASIGALFGVLSREDRGAVAATVTRTVEKTVAETVEKTITVSAEQPAVAATTTTAKPAGAATTFGAGRWEVGVDIAAGKYKSPSANDTGVLGCNWTRYSNDGADVIDLGYSKGPQTITVKAGELLEIDGCENWVRA